MPLINCLIASTPEADAGGSLAGQPELQQRNPVLEKNKQKTKQKVEAMGEVRERL